MSLPDAISGAGEKIGHVEITQRSNASSASSGSQSSQVGLCRELETEEFELPVALVGEMEGGSDAVKEYYCGFGRCRPKWLQVFRNSTFFTVILCLNCAIEGAIVSGKCVGILGLSGIMPPQQTWETVMMVERET